MTRIKAWHGFAGIRLRILLGLMLCALPCDANRANSIDPDGLFPIFINGQVFTSSERGGASYWDSGVLEIVEQKTGYSKTEFKFVDGCKGFLPSNRYNAGIAQGTADAEAIYAVMKSSAKDGVISEQLQIISHSRGTAFASGYMKSVSNAIANLAKKDNMTFSYDSDKIVEYSVNIGPHQPMGIFFGDSGTVNVNISHYADVFSVSKAIGNVINIRSCTNGLNQHGNKSYISELKFVLPILEAGGSKSDIKSKLINTYRQWDKKHPNLLPSIVR